MNALLVAAGEKPAVVPLSKASLPPRPPSAKLYRTLDTASVQSWSADAYGRAKEPGWYHKSRKQLYAQRAAVASAAPKGTYVSHSKYADEAARVAPTGRLAF